MGRRPPPAAGAGRNRRRFLMRESPEQGKARCKGSRKRSACGHSSSSLRSAPFPRPYALRGDGPLGRSAASSSSGREPPAGLQPAGGWGWTQERPVHRPHAERRGEHDSPSRPYALRGDGPLGRSAASSSSGREPPAGLQPAGGWGWTQERPAHRPHAERRGEHDSPSRPYALRGDGPLGRSAASSSSGREPPAGCEPAGGWAEVGVGRRSVRFIAPTRSAGARKRR